MKESKEKIYKIMGNNKEDNEGSVETNWIADPPETKIWVNQLYKILILVPLIIILFYTISIIESLIIHKPAFNLPYLSPFETDSKILGYYSFTLFLISICILSIASNISQALKQTQDQISLYMALLGTFTISLSITLLLFDHQFHKDWWRLISIAAVGLGLVFQTFSGILVRRDKLIGRVLGIIALILLCFGAVGFSVNS